MSKILEKQLVHISCVGKLLFDSEGIVKHTLQDRNKTGSRNQMACLLLVFQVFSFYNLLEESASILSGEGNYYDIR